MILAAGLGTRLRPLTESISKPMAPIVNKPVMEHILELLAAHGLIKVIANLHCHAEAIRAYFKDGSLWNIELSYSYEEQLRGTAGGGQKGGWISQRRHLSDHQRRCPHRFEPYQSDQVSPKAGHYCHYSSYSG
nr:sugar phosphate nucleotidyltransferase [Candidatus Hakubella thermalkaliphila]